MSANQQALLMGGAASPLTFFAPLLNTLVPTTAGAPTATFTRASTAYVSAVAPAGNAVDGEVLILCDVDEARFQGARRVSSGVWSTQYADGSPIPDAKLFGCVIENAATNLLLWSQDFTNAAWVKVGATVTPNTHTAPDGTLTGSTLACTSGNDTMTQTVTSSASTQHTFDIYMKRIAGTGIVSLVLDGVATQVQTLINTTTWTRVAASKNLSVGARTAQVLVQIPGNSVAIWGAMVEPTTVGSTAPFSTYILTTTATVTRATDLLAYGMAANLSGGPATTYTETYLFGSRVTAGPAPLQLSAGANFSPHFYNSGEQLATFTVASGSFVTSNIRLVRNINKNASAWGSGTGSICLNGEAVGTGTMANYTVSGSIYVGGASPKALDGCVRNVKFYNARMTNGELQTLTTPPVLPNPYTFVAGTDSYHGSSAITVLATPAINTPAGVHIFVFTSADNSSSVMTVTDTAGNAYTRSLFKYNATGASCQWHYKFNAAGNAANVITLTLTSGSSAKTGVMVMLFSGTTTGVELETGNTASGSTGVATPSFSTSAPVLILAGRAAGADQTAWAFTSSSGAVFTPVGPVDPDAPGVNRCVYAYARTTYAFALKDVTETGNSAIARAMSVACFK